MTFEATPTDLKHSKHMGNVSTELGARLRRAREVMHLTQQDIAQKLHLKLQIVVAMEEDDYEKIAVPTFAKGYLRLYAKVVGLSPDEIIECYNQLDLAEVVTTKLLPPKRIPHYKLSKILRYLIITVVLALIFLAGRWLYIENILHYNGIEPVLNVLEKNKVSKSVDKLEN